jgi:hypothetical protein
MLGVAEGIESALAVHKDYPQLPVWACYNDRQLSLVQVPDSVNKLFILADVDLPTEQKPEGAGAEAANALFDRLKIERPRLSVEIVTPSYSDRVRWARDTGNNPNKCDHADIAVWRQQMTGRKAA